jgi:hypothetical protein
MTKEKVERNDIGGKALGVLAGAFGGEAEIEYGENGVLVKVKIPVG